MIPLLLAHAVSSGIFTLAKVGLSYTQPIFFVALRAFITGVLLLFYVKLSGGRFLIKPKHYGYFLLFSLTQAYLAFVFEFSVIAYVKTSKWALIYALSPFLTAFFAYLVYRERITWLKGLGFVIGFLGLLPTILDHNVTESVLGGWWRISLPELAIFASAISYAYSWIVAQRLVRILGYAPTLANGVSLTLGGFLLFCTSPIIDSWSKPLISDWPYALLTIGLVVVATLISASMNTFMLKKYSATFLTFIGFVDPIFVAFYGKIFLREGIDPMFYVSALSIFLGLYLYYREDLRLQNSM